MRLLDDNLVVHGTITGRNKSPKPLPVCPNPNINVKNVQRVIRWLKNNPDNYDQASWGHPVEHGCGTNCCIAGICSIFMPNEPTMRHIGGLSICTYHIVGAKFLGLTVTQASELFDAEPFKDRKPTAVDAIITLRRLITTGKVSWDGVNYA